MYLLKPVPHATIWGGEKLGQYIGENNHKIGHLYMVNGHGEMSNVILNGAHRGSTLKDIFPIVKEKWKLEEYEEFPLTIAMVDAAENLSIQVHPNDIAAKKLENKKIGKTESWFFLNAPKSGWIYAGCRCESKEQIKDAVSGKRMEEITSHINIESGDYICLEAGILHAMTSGSFVYEIEYGSDYTYRFYDYGRKDEKGNERELHVNKAIQAIDPQVIPKVKKMKIGEWIKERDYELCRKENIFGYRNESNQVECVSVIKGKGKYGGYKISAGMSVILQPKEEIRDVAIELAMVARVRKKNGES